MPRIIYVVLILYGHIDNMISFRIFNLRPETQLGDNVIRGLTILRKDESQATVEMYVFLGVNLILKTRS